MLINRNLNYLGEWAKENCPIFFGILFAKLMPIGVALMEKTYDEDPEMVPLIVTIEEKIAYNQAVKDCLKGFKEANQPTEYIDTVFIPALRRVVENRGSLDDLGLVKLRFPLYEQICVSGHFGLILAEV